MAADSGLNAHSGAVGNTRSPLEKEQNFRIRPDDIITFQNDGEAGKDLHTTLELENRLAKPVAYKLQTNAGQKFKVKNSIDLIPPETTTIVHILLDKGFVDLVSAKDKFKLMAVVCEGDSDILDLLRNPEKEDVLVRKIPCAVVPPPKVTGRRSESRLKIGHTSSDYAATSRRSLSEGEADAAGSVFMDGHANPLPPQDNTPLPIHGPNNGAISTYRDQIRQLSTIHRQLEKRVFRQSLALLFVSVLAAASIGWIVYMGYLTPPVCKDEPNFFTRLLYYTGLRSPDPV